MKKLYTCTVLSAAFMLTLVACSPKTKTAVSSTAKTEGATMNPVLLEGKTIMEAKCSGCHGIKPPQNYTTGQWDHILPSMAAKAKLTSEEQSKVHNYIYAMARQ